MFNLLDCTALALEDAMLLRKERDVEVKLVDIIDLTGDSFQYFYKQGYLSLAQSTLGSYVVVRGTN